MPCFGKARRDPGTRSPGMTRAELQHLIAGGIRRYLSGMWRLLSWLIGFVAGAALMVAADGARARDNDRTTHNEASMTSAAGRTSRPAPTLPMMPSRSRREA